MVNKNDFKIPSKERIQGLFVFCNKCKNRVNLNNGLKSNKCNHPAESLVFRYRYCDPIDKRDRVLVLNSKNSSEAYKEAFELKQKLEKPYLILDEKKSLKFDDLIPKYFNHLTGANIADESEKKMEERSKNHVYQISLAFQYLNDCVKKNYNRDLSKFTVDEFKHEHVEAFQRFLKARGIRINTVSKYIQLISLFYNYIDKFDFYNGKNYFSYYIKIEKTITKPNITIEEVEQLIIRLKNGELNKRQVFSNNTTKNHDHYWFSDFILLGLLSGGRREEIAELKFNNIVEKDGKPYFIKMIDYKVSKGKRLNEKQYIIKKVILTDEFCQFLVNIGYDKYKGQDRFLICDERKHRLNVCSEASHDFAFFCKQLFPNKEYSIKMLRKLYVTKAMEIFGNAASAITHHFTQKVIVDHYLTPEFIEQKAKEEMIFGLNFEKTEVEC